jgi:hypothetical protein
MYKLFDKMINIQQRTKFKRGVIEMRKHAIWTMFEKELTKFKYNLQMNPSSSMIGYLPLFNKYNVKIAKKLI